MNNKELQENRKVPAAPFASLFQASFPLANPLLFFIALNTTAFIINNSPDFHCTLYYLHTPPYSCRLLFYFQ